MVAGYWIFGRDMLNVNLDTLKSNNVTDIFLNYYAFEAHGENKVLNWIKEANNRNIGVHIWVQCFYDGEWHNPKTTDLTSKRNEIRRYANLNGVKGIHLDYLRYAGNAYKTTGGADAITQFVREVRNENPRTFLTCAVMPENQTKYYYGQDIEALGKIVNAIIPMAYKGNYKQGNGWLKSITSNFSKYATIWTGLQAYRSDNDTTLLSVDELQNDINQSIEGGAKGVVLFRYGLSQNIKFKEEESKVTKIATKLTVRRVENYLLAILTDANNNPLPNMKIGFADNGVKYKTTDSAGKARYTLNHLRDGKYSIKVAFFGDDKYQASERVDFQFKIGKPSTKLTVRKINDYLLAVLTDEDNKPITGVQIGFADNGVKYKTTDNAGKARYSVFHLNEGKHSIKVGFFGNDNYEASEKIPFGFWIGKIPTKLTVQRDGNYLVAKLSDADNKPVIGVNIGFADNGVKYVQTNNDGIAKYSIAHFSYGTFKIRVAFFGNDSYKESNRTDFQFTNEAPKPKPAKKKYGHSTEHCCEDMGQNNGHYCACHSLQEVFRNLTDIVVPQGTIAGWAGTTSAGTGHQGIRTAIAKFNNKYDKNLKIEEKSFSDVGWSEIRDILNSNDKDCIIHNWYRRGTNDGGGHYEVVNAVYDDTVNVQNSLGSRCSNGCYYGYIEYRTKSTFEYYINGISQKSIMVITNG